jgi:hypothetical protein
MSSPSASLESRRMAFLVVILGALTIVSVVLMVAAGGYIPAREGSEFSSPMVEFELALTPAEVLAVLDSPSTRAVLDANNRWDFFFMTCYSLLHCCFFLYMASLNRLRQRARFRSGMFIYAGFALSATMFVGDIIETRQLLRLSTAVTVENVFDLGLKTLIVSTRIKWAALFVASILLGLAAAGYSGRSPLILLSVLFASAGTVGLMSLLHAPARPLCELASTMMALAWLWLLAHAALSAFGRRGK